MRAPPAKSAGLPKPSSASPPFLHGARLGVDIIGPLLRRQPEAGDAIQARQYLAAHAAGDEHGHVVDPAARTRAGGTGPSAASRRRRALKSPTAPAVRVIICLLPSPAELRERRAAHQLANLHGVLDARTRPAGQQEARNGRHIASGSRRAAPDGRASNNARGGFGRARIDDFAGGGRAAPAPILVIGRVER